MWAYYADSHKGVCLEFDIKSDTNLSINCHKIQYSDVYIATGKAFDNYFRKSEQWMHEQEWRIVCHTDEEYISTTSLKSIILGCKTPIDQITEFILLAKERNLPVYQMNPSNSKYELVLTPILKDGVIILGNMS